MSYRRWSNDKKRDNQKRYKTADRTGEKTYRVHYVNMDGRTVVVEIAGNNEDEVKAYLCNYVPHKTITSIKRK